MYRVWQRFNGRYKNVYGTNNNWWEWWNSKGYSLLQGKCDQILQDEIKESEGNGFRDLITFVNPYLYINNIMQMMDRMFEGKGFANQEAFNAYSDLILNCYQYVSRNLSEEEKEFSKNISLLPL